MGENFVVFKQKSEISHGRLKKIIIIHTYKTVGKKFMEKTKPVQNPDWPVLSSKLTLPLMVLTTDSGCSKISFCMKELKLPVEGGS